jgi:hypothetical protein
MIVKHVRKLSLAVAWAALVGSFAGCGAAGGSDESNVASRSQALSPPTPGDPFALQASNGKFVSADFGLGGLLVANRGVVGLWEVFTAYYYDDGSVAFKNNGKWVSADLNIDTKLIANRPVVGAWEKFQVAELGGNEIALHADIRGWVSADRNLGNVLIANRGTIDLWETFTKRFPCASDADCARDSYCSGEKVCE